MGPVLVLSEVGDCVDESTCCVVGTVCFCDPQVEETRNIIERSGSGSVQYSCLSSWQTTIEPQPKAHGPAHERDVAYRG